MRPVCAVCGGPFVDDDDWEARHSLSSNPLAEVHDRCCPDCADDRPGLTTPGGSVILTGMTTNRFTLPATLHDGDPVATITYRPDAEGWTVEFDGTLVAEEVVAADLFDAVNDALLDRNLCPACHNGGDNNWLSPATDGPFGARFCRVDDCRWVEGNDVRRHI